MRITVKTSRRLARCSLVLLSFWATAAFAATTYHIDPDASDFRILVFRAGLFGKLAHNHLVATHSLTGTVVLGDTATESSVTAGFPVASLTVDEASLRAQEGPDFSAEVDDGAIEGTRKNMLGAKLLDAENHESIHIESDGIEGELPNVTMALLVTVKGQQRRLTVPVSVNTYDDQLVAVGRLRMKQSDIGLKPFEAALGSLKVADEMLVKFRVVARTGAG